MRNGQVETMATVGSSFLSGLLYGGLGKYWPKTTLPVALTEAIGGPIGAVFTKGMLSEILEGVGSAGVALVGASMPDWISPPEEGASIGFIPAGKSIRLARKNPNNPARELAGKTARDRVTSTAIAEI